MGKSPFCLFVSFLIVSLATFIYKPNSSSDWTVFIISFIYSFEIINVFVLDPNISLWIAASVADAAAVNPDGIKTLVANGLSTFPIKDSSVLNSYLNINLILIFYAKFFDKFLLAEELFARALRSIGTFVLVNNNLCRKLIWSLESPTTFNEFSKLLQYYFLF